MNFVHEIRTKVVIFDKLGKSSYEFTRIREGYVMNGLYCINKPSVTKIEAADSVNLLHSTSCRFEQYKSLKPSQTLVSLPRYALFHHNHQKDSCFQALNVR